MLSFKRSHLNKVSENAIKKVVVKAGNISILHKYTL